MPVTMEEITMTPEIAREIIVKNVNNRAVNEIRIGGLVTQMKMGLWQQNGETIIVADTGRLLDGQHRLAAVIASGCSIPMIVVRGVAEDSFHTINTGKSRRAADILTIAGYRNVSAISSAASQFYRMIWTALDDKVSVRRTSVPPGVVLEVVERWPKISTWCSQASGMAVTSRVPISSLVPALIYLSDIAKRPDLSTALYEGLATGAYLASGSPILTLRNKVYELRVGGVANTDWVWSYMVTVVDALEEGRQLPKLSSAKPYQVSAPRHLREHLAKLSDREALLDLKPPAVLTKIRDQRDILGMAGISDRKAMDAVVDHGKKGATTTAEQRHAALKLPPPSQPGRKIKTTSAGTPPANLGMGRAALK